MRQHRHTPFADREAGSVSVEFALGLIGAISVFAMILAGLDAAHAQSQACQLARDGARHAVLAAASGTTGSGVASGLGSVVTHREGQWVRAHAQWPLRSPVSWLASHMSCDIQTLAEPAEPW